MRSTAYEALNTTLMNGAQDTREHIKQILPLIIQRLEQSFKMQIVSSDDKEAQSELQGLLCGTLQVTMQKLNAEALPWCDVMMALFLQAHHISGSIHFETVLVVLVDGQVVLVSHAADAAARFWVFFGVR